MGPDVGWADGQRVGFEVGWLVGRDVGCEDGFDVGETEGLTSTVGSGLGGKSVGCNVGTS